MTEQKKQKPAKISALVDHLTRLVIGCLVMMWGVINLVHNFLNWRAFSSESAHWWVTIAFVLVTGVLPLLIGIWILIRETHKS